MVRLPLILTVLVALAAAGIVSGIWTGRFGESASIKEAAAHFDRVPLHVGDWDGKVVEEDETVAGVVGPYSVRRYVNRTTGVMVSTLVNVDRPGPIFVNHTPLSCYPPNGWNLTSDPKRQFIPQGEGVPTADFWVAQFDKTEQSTPVYTRVYWSWTGDGHWQVPESPRLTFARYSLVYKLYVERRLAKQDEPLETDPVNDFIRVFVPELNKTLFKNPDS